MLEKYLELLKQFAQRVGLVPAELFLQRQEIVIDDLAISLSCEELKDSNNILCFSLLGIPNKNISKTVYMELLEANCFWIGTGGATLGIQEHSGEVIICSKISLDDLNVTDFSKFIDNFSEIAHYWKKVISKDPVHNISDKHSIGSLV